MDIKSEVVEGVNVLREISEERQRQVEKFPGDEKEMDLFFALSVLGEEIGEAHKAAVDLRFKILVEHSVESAALRTELIQTAAVAVKLVELLDRDALYISQTELPAAKPSKDTWPPPVQFLNPES